MLSNFQTLKHYRKEHSAKERICMEPHKEKVLKVFFACTTPKTTNKYVP